MRRRRVALVAASLEILGGHGVQARLLLEGLGRDGYEVSFIPIDARFPALLRPARRLKGVRTLVNQALYWPSLLALRRADVVHAFSASYWSFLLAPLPALLAARAFGKRAVLHYHSGEADDHLRRYGALVHPWLRLAHAIVVPSEYLRAVFARHGYAARAIPNVADLGRFRYRERGPLAPRLLSVRSLEPPYAVDDTLRAFALVRCACPQAQLLVAGGGSQDAALRRLAADLGDAVTFLGRVEPERMPDLYDAADVLLNAALVDNQPVSLLEAFAAGLPVVSTPTGDIPSMLCHGEAGRLVPARNPSAMAGAVLSLVRDPDQARQIARRAREQVEAHVWERLAPRWAEVYGGCAA